MKHPREISALLTAAIAAGIAVMLTTCSLSWNPTQAWPPEPDPYIELADVQEDEFIEPEPVPMPRNAPILASAPAKTKVDIDQPSRVAPPKGTSTVSKGRDGKPAQTVTSNRPSPVKEVAKKVENPGTPEPDESAETRARATRNVSDAFTRSSNHGNANNGNGDTGIAGRTDGNPRSAGSADSHGTAIGMQRGNVTGGWLWPSYGAKVQTSLTGSVKLTLTIDSQGRVKARQSGGTAPASADARLVARCIAIAESGVFTRAAGAQPAPDRATATLTFTFK